MLVKFLIWLSALSLGLPLGSCTTPQQQAQLATLHDRMNQLLSSIYTSPLLSKVQAAASSEESPSTTSQETSYSYPAAPAPQIVFISPPAPSYLDAGAHPNDYGFPVTTNPVPRAAFPSVYSEYGYQFTPPAYSPVPKPLYPEYPRTAYPQAPVAPGLSPALPYTTPSPYSPPYASQIPYPNSVSFAQCPPGYPVTPYSAPVPYAPSLFPTYPSYPPAIPYPTTTLTSPSIGQQYNPSIAFSSVPTPYPGSIPIAYPPTPMSYSPSPVPYPSALTPYPSSVPVVYPPPPSMPYSPYLPYPQPLYPPPAPYPNYPKPSDILPQPQYDYSG